MYDIIRLQVVGSACMTTGTLETVSGKGERMQIVCVTRSLDDPDKTERHYLDDDKHGDRRWLAERARWAMRNRCSITTFPKEN